MANLQGEGSSERDCAQKQKQGLASQETSALEFVVDRESNGLTRQFHHIPVNLAFETAGEAVCSLLLRGKQNLSFCSPDRFWSCDSGKICVSPKPDRHQWANQMERAIRPPSAIRNNPALAWMWILMTSKFTLSNTQYPDAT